MENSANIERNKKVFDALFNIAAEEALKEEMDALPSCEELNEIYPRTKSLDKKVYDAINREKRIAKRKKTINTFTKIAAGFCIIAMLCMGALMSVEASRNFILNFLIDMRGDYIVFDFGVEERSHSSVGEIVLNYKPEGFELINTHTQDTLRIYVFMDDADQNIIIQRFIGTNFTMGVDYEYMEFSEVLINGEPAKLFISSDGHIENKIMWIVGEDVITIITCLDVVTLIKIAENLIVR
ncbi:MAG: DUF4367 domain-containing protein [Defluviitaleaceae bacterium]|nr:DUF4367 domain-containing protein [Defluviitaleaceae bacterium]